MRNAYIPERRQTRRIQAIYCAKYRYYDPQTKHLDSQEYEALTLDISETGVALVTDREVPIGTNLVIKFTVNKFGDFSHSRFSKVILFTGTVAYSVPRGNDLYRLGIYFGPATKKNEIKFFDVVCSPMPSLEEEHTRKFFPATLHMAN